MVEGMKPSLMKGNTFVAVGAGHLSGIISQLAEEGYKIHPVKLGKRYYPIKGTLDDGKKVKAFRTIYLALFYGQSGWKIKDSLFPANNKVVTFKTIKCFVQKNPVGRTAKAWHLANLYFQNVSPDNTQLFAKIHKYSYKHSVSDFLKKQIFLLAIKI